MTAKMFAMKRNSNKWILAGIEANLIRLMQSKALMDGERLMLEPSLSAVRAVLKSWDLHYMKAKKEAGYA